MTAIEIADDVYEALRADNRKRFPGMPVDGIAEDVLRRYLADACAPGFDRDGLTGCLSRQRLRKRVNQASLGAGWKDTSIFRERFLCIDLDDFKRYLDVYSLLAGDLVLRELGGQLRDHYGTDVVSRTGGDEFVVVLGGNGPW